MTCEDLIEYLSDYLDHELDTDLVRAAKDHFATCERCQIVLHTTEGVISLGQRQQRQVLPPARRERLFARLQSAFLGTAGDGHE